MQQAVEDKTVTPLLYEERIPELAVQDKAIDAWFERSTKTLSDKQKADLKKKFSQKGQVYQTEDRIRLIAYDISEHFQNFKYKGLKGQLACDSKAPWRSWSGWPRKQRYRAKLVEGQHR